MQCLLCKSVSCVTSVITRYSVGWIPMTKCNKIIKVYVPGRDLGLVDSSHCFNDLQLDLTEDKLLETRLGLKSLRLDLN